MEEDKQKNIFYYITKSKFVRTIFLQIVLIFFIVIISVIGIAFISFTSELNKSIISEKQSQLNRMEVTISKRMEEISSIAYNINNDNTFFMGAVTLDEYSGYEMSKILERYLVGNDFIEHLAYYRLSEPNIIYASSGQLSFSGFLNTYLGLSIEKTDEIISEIKTFTTTHISIFSSNKSSPYLSCIYPLPPFSKEPQAFVLMLIPVSEITPIFEAQLENYTGKVALYDSNGAEIYHVSNLEDDINIDLNNNSSESYLSVDGKKYVVLRKESPNNGWIYVSVIRLNDIISEVSNKQLLFIALLLVIMFVAIGAMLICIVIQYKPINKLAMTLDDNSDNSPGKIIDEESLISDTFATLKDDSEQKQKYESAFHEAEAANKAKSTFLSNMSHDIRTPMNAIVGMTEIASKNLEDTPYVKECLQKVSVASQYLLDIINNVLDMSRIESGNFTLSNDIIEFPKLIYGIITILNQSLDVKYQRLIVDVGNISNEKVYGDNVRLTQVFMNILSNSIKFTPTGGIISLKLSQIDSSEEGYSDYLFVFSDNGIGMSEDFIGKIFDTFTRDQRTDISHIEGTGLGMAIAKNFVELMGGSIKCESVLNKGTTFTIKMHMKLADEPIDNTSFEKYKNVSVLILGEDYSICSNQINLFNEIGVQAEYTNSIENASNKIEHSISYIKPYNFIIINQSEKDKSGIDTVTRLSKIISSSDTTFVLAARDLLSVKRSHAYNMGISAFVQIPLFKSTLLSILDRTFELQNTLENDNLINLEDCNVLLVEDNKVNREIARVMISGTKANVFEATNGKEAVETFKEHDIGFFSIILMDIQMPIMNGYEATSSIRSIQREDALTIPIYAMTANTFDEDVRQVKEAGMNGHLGKPYVSEELYKILREALKK